MSKFDAIEWANSARREIDATGAARANAGRGVHSIEGAVNHMTAKPPVPPSVKKKPFGKPGQTIKGFGNAEGLKRIKPLTGPGPGDIKKYLEAPNSKGPLGF